MYSQYSYFSDLNLKTICWPFKNLFYFAEVEGVVYLSYFLA